MHADIRTGCRLHYSLARGRTMRAAGTGQRGFVVSKNRRNGGPRPRAGLVIQPGEFWCGQVDSEDVIADALRCIRALAIVRGAIMRSKQ